MKTSTTVNGSVRKWKRHPAYKDSSLSTGVQIPGHWSMTRLKHVAIVRPSNVDKKTVEGQEAVRLCNYVDVYKNDYITEAFDFMQASATPAQIAAFTLKASDVIITKDSETWDDIAVPAYVTTDLPGVLCGYHLALVRPEPERVNGEYLFRSFGAEGICDQFRVAANGIIRFGLDTTSISSSLFPLPPLDEQRHIVAFLDRETAKIDALIAKKERLIELLQEKRTALISRAVTKGLDPTVSMKDSGVAWLGRIPAHWNVKRLKFCLYKMEQGWSPDAENREASPDEWAVMRAGCVNSGTFDETDHKALPNGVVPDDTLEIHSGDLLMSRACGSAKLVGSVALVRQSRRKLILCDKLFRLRYRTSVVTPQFLEAALQSPMSRYQIERDLSGAEGLARNIGQSMVRVMTIPTPPLREQEEIINCLKKASNAVIAMVAKVREAIDKLREYRTALISAAVTGKIDVREEVD